MDFFRSEVKLVLMARTIEEKDLFWSDNVVGISCSTLRMNIEFFVLSMSQTGILIDILYFRASAGALLSLSVGHNSTKWYQDVFNIPKWLLPPRSWEVLFCFFLLKIVAVCQLGFLLLDTLVYCPAVSLSWLGFPRKQELKLFDSLRG